MSDDLLDHLHSPWCSLCEAPHEECEPFDWQEDERQLKRAERNQRRRKLYRAKHTPRTRA